MTRTAKRVARKREPATDRTAIRVAIYTRKSVTDGLDQAFNTLDAQREAVESYVRSQAAAGWRALGERYDDGGFSGANIERPAFQRLMADVAAGKVDVVAVYRLDRLSRSLVDFAGLMREFEQRGVAFVSVTERFDTSTPMGRMVLNMLATFAQFERETIALRTKDKVSASRRRGMWTGGRPVLGYDVVEKKLVVNEREAEDVRRIFQLYLDLGGVVAVVEELRLLGITNKRWTTKSGADAGGNAFDKNTVASMLKSPLYVGDVRAGDEVVPGEHEDIVEREVWDAVQRQMAAQAPSVPARAGKRSTALLSGIARCKCGAAMTPVHTRSGPKRYGYYVCANAVKSGRAACPKSRVPVGTLEQFVVQRIREVGRDPAVLDAAIAADRGERDVERARLDLELRDLRTGRGRHAGERDRVVAAVGAGEAPQGLVARVAELDALVGEADARAAALERDLAALDGTADADAIRTALEEFDSVWSALEQEERARVLALVLDEIVVDGTSGEAELRFRSTR